MLVDCEQVHLLVNIFTFLDNIIAQHRTMSHRLEIEEVQWFNIDKSEQICGLCGGVNIEDKDNVYVTCQRYQKINLTHKIDMKSLYTFLESVTYDLGYVRYGIIHSFGTS